MTIPIINDQICLNCRLYKSGCEGYPNEPFHWCAGWKWDDETEYDGNDTAETPPCCKGDW